MIKVLPCVWENPYHTHGTGIIIVSDEVYHSIGQVQSYASDDSYHAHGTSIIMAW